MDSSQPLDDPGASSRELTDVPPATPDDNVQRDRAGSLRERRSSARARASWMSARARNAARRVVFISAIGAAAVIITLLALISLPREADRVMRAQLNALRETQDTVGLADSLTRARERRVAAIAFASSARQNAPASAAATVVASAIGAANRAPLPVDSLSAELQQQISRARSAPLVESYRALAGSRLLRDDGRLGELVDSIQQLDREREAYAALGGPDARYASFTTRLAALGARLIRIGEARLESYDRERRQREASRASNSATATSSIGKATDGTQNTALGSALDEQQGLPTVQSPLAESTLALVVNAATDTVSRLERILAEARSANDSLEMQRQAIRARSVLSIPPLAMLFAALVIGLAIGFASAIVREMRRPTVGDVSEAERVSDSRVIVHRGASSSAADNRNRRRVDRNLPPVIQPTAEAWQQLHLMISGLGDVVSSLQVISDQPLLEDSLAINLAGAAARESRATLLVESPQRIPMLGVLLRQTEKRGLRDLESGRSELREVISETAMGRDISVDVILAGGTGKTVPQPPLSPKVREEIRRVASRYDLALLVGKTTGDVGIPANDVVLCARLGVTPLKWLSQMARETSEKGNNLRAVVIWAADTPAA